MGKHVEAEPRGFDPYPNRSRKRRTALRIPSDSIQKSHIDADGSQVPIFHDSGQLGTSFGRLFLAAGTLGEVGPIVALALLLSWQYSSSCFLDFSETRLMAGCRLRFTEP